MPQLNGKKYAYTKKGKEQYKKDKKKKYTLSSAKKKLASMGRRGDTELEHVNKDEQRMLKSMGSARSKNPRTGLTENFKVPSFRPPSIPTPKIKVNVPSIKVNVPKSTGDIVKSLQSAYDRNVKPVAKKIETETKNVLPEGLDGQNLHRGLQEIEKGTGKFITGMGRAGVDMVYNLAGGQGSYYDQGSSSNSSSSSSSNVSTRTGGFGSVKRKKKKKRGMAESDTEGKDMSGGKMSKRGLRTPKRTGLNIVKKNSSSTSLGM